MTINKKGFTLLEVLLVVAAMAILAGIVILAINPVKQLADTRNAQRQVDVNTILNAVYQYSIDNKGVLPTIPATATGICATGTLPADCITDGLVDLSVLTTNGKYIVSMPVDPSGATDNDVNYQILKSATTGRITVSAPEAENSATISVTR